MKRLVAGCLLFLVFAVLVECSNASTEKTQVWVDESLYVTYSLEGINSTVYQEVKQQSVFNQTSIPQTILNNLEQQQLTHVEFFTAELVFDDSSNSVRAAFYMSGSDVLSSTINQTTAAKVYTVKTSWINFQFNLTPTLALNFTQYFGNPVDQWQKISYTDSEERTHPAYYLDYTEQAPFQHQCYFILPTGATNVQAWGDTITFEFPPSTGEVLLNSPFTILATLIIVIIALALFRRVRK